MVAQLITVASLPVLSRLYSPDDVARYGALLGLGTVLASIASLRLDLAIPLPDAEGDSRALFWIAVTVALGFSIVGLPLALLVSSAFGTLDSIDPGVGDWLAVFAFVLLLSIFSALAQFAIRLRIYGSLGRIPMLQSGATAVLQVGLGFTGFANGLFVGAAGGRAVGISGLVRACRITTRDYPNRSRIQSLLRRFWRFPLVFAPASLIEVLGSQIAVLLLPGLYGLTAAGLFAMALRLVGTPMQLVGQSAGQVFLGEFARTSTPRAGLRVFMRWSGVLGLTAVFMGVLAWVLPPLLLTPLLGSEWAAAVPITQWLGIASAAALVGSPVQHVWTVRQRAWAQAGWNVLRLTVVVVTLVGAATHGVDSIDAVMWLSMGLTLAYMVSWVGCLLAARADGAGRPQTPATTAVATGGP